MLSELNWEKEALVCVCVCVDMCGEACKIIVSGCVAFSCV